MALPNAATVFCLFDPIPGIRAAADESRPGTNPTRLTHIMRWAKSLGSVNQRLKIWQRYRARHQQHIWRNCSVRHLRDITSPSRVICLLPTLCCVMFRVLRPGIGPSPPDMWDDPLHAMLNDDGRLCCIATATLAEQPYRQASIHDTR